jgi:hypothetical protein
MDFGEYLRRIQVRNTYTDYIAKEQRISQGCGTGSYYDGRTIPEGNRIDILSGQLITTPAETSTILGSRIANCPEYVPPSPPPPPPMPSTTIVADLTGVDFSSGGSFISTFTFASMSTITVGFINNTSANMSSATHIDFRRDALPNLSSNDTFTIENPSYTPATQWVTYGPGNIYSQIYANETFGLTTSSIITFVGENSLTDITFNISMD